VQGQVVVVGTVIGELEGQRGGEVLEPQQVCYTALTVEQGMELLLQHQALALE
jgi:hypothetical protein